MTRNEIEGIIIDHGYPMQSILEAAWIIEELVSIGGTVKLGIGGDSGQGGKPDPARILDLAYSLTRHIRDHEHHKLRQWVKTHHIEPHDWPRVALAFWLRVPERAARDMAKVTGGVV